MIVKAILLSLSTCQALFFICIDSSICVTTALGKFYHYAYIKNEETKAEEVR